MNIVAAIVAGLAGTAVMTAMMYVAPSMGMPRMDILNMLGTMFVEPDGNAIGLGAVAHFMMGSIFGIVYALLWTTVGIGAAGWLWGLIFGVVHGLVAIVAMPIMMGNLHTAPARDGAGTDDDCGSDRRSRRLWHYRRARLRGHGLASQSGAFSCHIWLWLVPAVSDTMAS